MKYTVYIKNYESRNYEKKLGIVITDNINTALDLFEEDLINFCDQNIGQYGLEAVPIFPSQLSKPYMTA